MTPTSDDARRVNEQIAETLRDEIKTGRLKVGDKLPSVRAIAERFEVAPGTATKAVQLLAKWELVAPDSTRGYFVSAQVSGDEEVPGPSPEFAAIMEEVAAMREHLARLDERLQRLEDSEKRG
ncbi:putative HTH-type transcriptional regulator YjiR [Streptomyces sp. YIM 121038]|uniref:GntR family transcriptional regulator n=1 Tax=Streptomyces sp. YIM 121038 TaxID=2136401 RepID=UPI0011103801|nr:winged helix-turn-helix domain-containing protein [Streptomyces sp. YIM 121038]QCX74942.1 putative HTH-type transcriptional regulator YjiR [Streptomyces sp. YIM 121038]